MSFQSCSHPAKPVLKSRIRGETTLAGYIIKPSEKVPNSTDFCILSQVDIKVRLIVGRDRLINYREVFQRWW